MQVNSFFQYFILIMLSIYTGALWSAPPFRFHLVNEPASLKPWDQQNSAAGYLLSQVTGTLLTYKDHKLQENLAQSCKQIHAKKVACILKPNLKWSDGSNLSTEDFIRSFQQFLDPKNRAFRADLLFPILNAEKIYKGELPIEKLGISAKGSRLEFNLAKPDSEFIYILSSPLLAPIPKQSLPSIEQIRENPKLLISSGPYQIDQWTPLQKILLSPNPNFWKKNSRPNLEVLPIAEDSVALKLYEKGELSFLRRLPTLFIQAYKGKPELFEIDQFRFDYLTFSPKWKSSPDFRKALSRSLKYTELQSLFSAKGTPGCPGISESLHNEKICHEFDLPKAQKLLGSFKPTKKIEILYSKQGGDDHKRMMEWAQNQWLTNLKLETEVFSLDNKIFLEKLQDISSPSAPDLFRKGLAPDRPTCLSALEAFETNNRENYLKYSNPKFDQVIEKLKGTLNSKEKAQLCDQGIRLLMDEAYIIPTGPIHFTLLAKPEWTGWNLNELNQLDLSDLEFKK